MPLRSLQVGLHQSKFLPPWLVPFELPAQYYPQLVLSHYDMNHRRPDPSSLQLLAPPRRTTRGAFKHRSSWLYVRNLIQSQFNSTLIRTARIRRCTPESVIIVHINAKIWWHGISRFVTSHKKIPTSQLPRRPFNGCCWPAFVADRVEIKGI